ncbi:MAG: CheR family methyltransferase, partial [Bacteroidota bacterium]
MRKKTLRPRILKQRPHLEALPLAKESVEKNDPRKRTTAPNTPQQLPVVAIGASAGGLEALEQFFMHMPKENGMAFVVIQHLEPTRPGMLPELLQRVTAMKVIQVTDRMPVAPNTVFVIPPNKSMSILHGLLHLFEPVETRGLRLPIDVFFRSLAEDRRENSIGIVLSGMGSDGSIGLKAIKEKYGIVLVQDPESAKFDGMPRSALKSVIADVTAAAEILPVRLIELLKHAPPATVVPTIDEENSGFIEKIIILLREQTGHEFSQYKKHTLFRRIERRKNIHQLGSLQLYVRFLQENPKETEILFKELLIGVTNFFRDPAVWDMLRDKVLPEMFSEFSNGQVVRAWVPGCSTGEEAYSLAMVMKEAAESVKKNISIQIFASDLDADSIEIARKGNYQKNIAVDVSPERLKRFFTEENNFYHIRSEIRETVIFAAHNVIKDPPFTRLDILTCRNMLIYFEAELQKKLMTLFHYTLKSGGILLLGSSETLSGRKGGFRELDTKKKLYKRTNLHLPFELIDFPTLPHTPRTTSADMTLPTQPTENIQTVVDQMLLQHYTPASVLVNRTGDILYITGETGKFLAPVAGKANWNIYAMARRGLHQALPALFRKAMLSYEPVYSKSLQVETDGGNISVDLTVQRIKQPESIRDYVLVVFTEAESGPAGSKKRPVSEKRTRPAKQSDLEKELILSQDELQRLREE